MSIQYKTYPIYIDGGTMTDDVISVVTKPKHVSDFETAVTNILDTITKRSNGIGQRLFSSFPLDKNIVIVPYNPAEFDNRFGTCNALASDATTFERGEARVRFSPSIWKAGGQCATENSPGIGAGEDEILLHELLHTYRKVRGTFNRIPLNIPDLSYENIEEYFAIVVSNVYISENGKPYLRKDHANFDKLPSNLANSEKFFQDKENHKWISYFWNMEQPFSLYVASSSAPFNPFRSYKNWLDNKHRIATTSW
jgi:hypothetical protein